MKLTIGQTFLLTVKLAEVGFTTEEVAMLGQAQNLLKYSPRMLGIRDVLDGYSKIESRPWKPEFNQALWSSIGKSGLDFQKYSYVPIESYRLMRCLEFAGFSPEDVTKLGQFADLAEVRKLLAGKSRIVLRQHQLDLDVAPNEVYCIRNTGVVKHVLGGQIVFDQKKFVPQPLNHSTKGRKNKTLRQLVAELGDKQLCNAALLKFYIRYPKLIPFPDWSNVIVLFCGTVYRDPDGEFVLCLEYVGGDFWRCRKAYLDREANQKCQVLVVA
ncbi:MAG: hypothetical protein JW816_00845 [Candidatus Buchananbacteria bacterium]|nr:hypothetical protein [Candidatus Buchananbacteria bacterium]